MYLFQCLRHAGDGGGTGFDLDIGRRERGLEDVDTCWGSAVRAAGLAGKFVQIGEHAVHYLHSGATTLPRVRPALDRGQLFVLLHCAGGCAGLWRRQVEGLSDGHSVVAIDMPGHGRSGGVDGLTTIDANVALLAQFADALPLRPFVLVGHGLGATIALAFAARHGARLRGLVLVGATLQPDLGDALGTLRQVVQGRLPQQFSPEFFSPQTTPAIMREFFTGYVTTDPRVRLADLEAAHGHDCAPACRSISIPTLVITGEDDRIAPPAAGTAVAQAIAGARTELIAAAGHALGLEQPEAFNQALAHFAAGLAS